MENLLSNKYFCLALIVVVAFLLYLYYQKSPCEGFTGIPLQFGPQHLYEPPWANYPGDYKRYNNKFDLMADQEAHKKLKRLGLENENFKPLKSLDNMHKKYVNSMKKYWKLPYYDPRDMDTYYPKPLDDHPELSQCQPCNCDTSGKWSGKVQYGENDYSIMEEGDVYEYNEDDEENQMPTRTPSQSLSKLGELARRQKNKKSLPPYTRKPKIEDE
jgi:hypothetical protein